MLSDVFLVRAIVALIALFSSVFLLACNTGRFEIKLMYSLKGLGRTMEQRTVSGRKGARATQTSALLLVQTTPRIQPLTQAIPPPSYLSSGLKKAEHVGKIEIFELLLPEGQVFYSNMTEMSLAC